MKRRIRPTMPMPAAVSRRVRMAWGSSPGPRGGLRAAGRRGRSARSSRNAKVCAASGGQAVTKVLPLPRLKPRRGRESRARAEHERDMERPSTTPELSNDPRTPPPDPPPPAPTQELSNDSRPARLAPSRTGAPRRFGPREGGKPRELVLDRYRLERRLGAGGFGVVWLAFDEKLEREVAVKVVPRDDDPVPQRATREARVAARLNHPGIVALYELGSDDDAVYLVSELVPGRTLAELMK